MDSTLRLRCVALAIALAACDDDSDGDSGSCYSPTQNLDDAHEKGAKGCACKDEEDVCVLHEGAYRAFFCEEGHWVSGFDGPCGVDQKRCYSPKQHLERAYEEGAIGCACAAGSESVCVEGVGLVCSDGRWQAVEDGPCAPQGGS